MIAMIGTSDRLCWLAETCKILLLLFFFFSQFEFVKTDQSWAHSFVSQDGHSPVDNRLTKQRQVYDC